MYLLKDSADSKKNSQVQTIKPSLPIHFFKKEYFRFGFLDQKYLGTCIFTGDGNRYANISYKGKKVGEALYNVVPKSSFKLFARLNMQSLPYQSISPDKFVVDINTTLLDSTFEWIFSGDYITIEENPSFIYEVGVCIKSGQFYLQPINCKVNDTSQNLPLTDLNKYDIVGNRVEGIFHEKFICH